MLFAAQERGNMQDCLALAFLGDAVYSLSARDFLLNFISGKIGVLHKELTKIVNANAQAKVYDEVCSSFDEEEKEIARRARNIKINNVPKASSLEEYKKSTSLEAVFGYNYLQEKDDRLAELFSKAIDLYKKEKGQVKK